MPACQVGFPEARVRRSYSPRPHDEQEICRRRDGGRRWLVPVAGLIQRGVGAPARGLANLQRAEPVAEVDDFEMMPGLIRVGHEDQHGWPIEY